MQCFREVTRAEAPPKCRHCNYRAQRARSRGLCSSCFAKPEVREAYPMLARKPRGRDTPTCTHCEARAAVEPRGLCGPCYKNLEIRAMYPKRSTAPKNPVSVKSYGPLCRSCGEVRYLKARGLCNRCYADPKKLERFPSVSKYGPRKYTQQLSDDDFEGQAPLPPYPTDAPPGSERKIQVMAERARQKVQLFHPGDERMCERVKGRGRVPNADAFRWGGA